MAAYTNYLTLRHDAKAIPYGGFGEIREDGGANYGFKDLKGHPELISSVPELSSDEALKSLVVAVNAAESGLFSIGCLSGDVSEDQGFRRTGYIEFAINSTAAIADAARYFPIFFHFDELLLGQGAELRAVFNWELRAADFWEAQAVGFTCVITINTHFFRTSAEARECWNKGLELLQLMLPAFPQQPGSRLY